MWADLKLPKPEPATCTGALWGCPLGSLPPALQPAIPASGQGEGGGGSPVSLVIPVSTGARKGCSWQG